MMEKNCELVVKNRGTKSGSSETWRHDEAKKKNPSTVPTEERENSSGEGQLRESTQSPLAMTMSTEEANPITISDPRRAHDPFHLVGHVIGPTNLLELVACPCCQQCFDDLESHTTINEPSSCLSRNFSPQTARYRSLLTSHESGEEEEDEIEDDEDLLPGVLAAGVHYTPKRVLVEGWLHKKGTGKDWLGSRAWKARWARLALARVDGYDSDVPIMLIYWYQASAHASTVIVLDSTVVLSVDMDDKGWNSHRFEIRHVQKHDGSEPLATRTFSAPQKGRDAWVYAISQALLSYEKQKDKHRKLAHMHRAEAIVRRSRSPDRSSSPTYDEVWTGDRFVTVELRKPSSPPSSPTGSNLRSSTQHPSSPNLPRPKPRRTSASTATNGRQVAAQAHPSLLCQPSM